MKADNNPWLTDDGFRITERTGQLYCTCGKEHVCRHIVRLVQDGDDAPLSARVVLVPMTTTTSVLVHVATQMNGGQSISLHCSPDSGVEWITVGTIAPMDGRLVVRELLAAVLEEYWPSLACSEPACHRDLQAYQPTSRVGMAEGFSVLTTGKCTRCAKFVVDDDVIPSI